jgi:hypothetical protein
MAFDFEPAVAAIETLPDRRRRLRWSTIAFHLATRRGRQRGWPLLPRRELPSARILAPRIRLPKMTARDLLPCQEDRTHCERAAIPRGLPWRQPNATQ